MAYYYVKSGGTATGDGGRFASLQTGSFAALGGTAYYDDVEAAFGATTPPAGGDFILCSDAHNVTHTATQTWNGGAPAGVVTIMSVSDTNCDQYSAGATEDADGGSYDIIIGGAVVVDGLTMNIGDDLVVSNDSGIWIKDSIINMQGSGDLLFMANIDCALILIRTTITYPSGTTAAMINMDRGAIVHILGGELDGGSGTISYLVDNASAGGARLICSDVNMADVGQILNTGEGGGADDTFDIDITNCALPSGVVFADAAFVKPGQKITVTGSAHNTSSEYQFFQRTFGGDVQNETTIYRNESTAFDSGTKVSAKATTTANTSVGRVLAFDLFARFSDLTSAASDTFRIYFASTATLSDSQVWAEIYYSDGTNTHLSNYATNQASNRIGAGTAHTTDSGSDWRDGVGALTGYNEYYMDVTSTGDAGAACVAKIRIFVAVASATVYFDTTVDLV